jgi:hypothetical protein
VVGQAPPDGLESAVGLECQVHLQHRDIQVIRDTRGGLEKKVQTGTLARMGRLVIRVTLVGLECQVHLQHRDIQGIQDTLACRDGREYRVIADILVRLVGRAHQVIQGTQARLDGRA